MLNLNVDLVQMNDILLLTNKNMTLATNQELDKKLRVLVADIEQGLLQVDYNVNLGLHVIVQGDGLDFSYCYINKNGVVIKAGECGFSSGGGYYSAQDMAAQYSHLPPHLLITNEELERIK